MKTPRCAALQAQQDSQRFGNPETRMLQWKDLALDTERDLSAAAQSLADLLGFARRRLPTGDLPPQGARAIQLLAALGNKEYVDLYDRHKEAVDDAAGRAG